MPQCTMPFVYARTYEIGLSVARHEAVAASKPAEELSGPHLIHHLARFSKPDRKSAAYLQWYAKGAHRIYGKTI